MEMWTCDRPFKEPGDHPGPRGASQIGRSSLIPENGGKFGAKYDFITFSFNIQPEQAFLMEQGFWVHSHHVDLYHWGKKWEEKNWKNFSLYSHKRINRNWLMRKQTTKYYTTMHYISAFFNYYFFKLVFSVGFVFHRDAAGVFIMWCIWMCTCRLDLHLLLKPKEIVASAQALTFDP